MWGWSYLTTILISVAKFTEWKIKIFNKIFPWIAFLVEYIWVFLVSLVTRSEIESWENTVSILAGVLNASFGRVHSLVNRLNLDLTRPLQQFNTFYWSIWINYFYSWKIPLGKSDHSWFAQLTQVIIMTMNHTMKIYKSGERCGVVAHERLESHVSQWGNCYQ